MTKNYAVSYARLLSMIMIILCHIFQYYGNELAWWFNVGVQIFLIISGFLYAYRDIDDAVGFIKRQYKKILVPFWTYLLVITVIFIFSDRSSLSPLTIISAFTGAEPYPGLEHLWFIPYILVCYFLLPILCSLKKQLIKKTNASLLFLVIIITIALELLTRVYNSYFIASRIICFVWGYFYSVYYQSSTSEKKKNIFSSVIIIGAVVINVVRILIKYFNIIVLDKVSKALFGLYESYAHVILGLAIFIALIWFLNGVKESRIVKISDQYSYYVYITHHFFILSSFSLLRITQFTIINYLITFCLIIISSFILKVVSDDILRRIGS